MSHYAPKIHLKPQAIAMRENGETYETISEKLGVGTATLFNWCKEAGLVDSDAPDAAWRHIIDVDGLPTEEQWQAVMEKAQRSIARMFHVMNGYLPAAQRYV